MRGIESQSRRTSAVMPKVIVQNHCKVKSVVDSCWVKARHVPADRLILGLEFRRAAVRATVDLPAARCSAQGLQNVRGGYAYCGLTSIRRNRWKKITPPSLAPPFTQPRMRIDESSIRKQTHDAEVRSISHASFHIERRLGHTPIHSPRHHSEQTLLDTRLMPHPQRCRSHRMAR